MQKSRSKKYNPIIKLQRTLSIKYDCLDEIYVSSNAEKLCNCRFSQTKWQIVLYFHNSVLFEQQLLNSIVLCPNQKIIKAAATAAQSVIKSQQICHRLFIVTVPCVQKPAHGWHLFPKISSNLNRAKIIFPTTNSTKKSSTTYSAKPAESDPLVVAKVQTIHQWLRSTFVVLTTWI